MSLKDEILGLREKYTPKAERVEVLGKAVHVHEMSLPTKMDFFERSRGEQMVLVLLRCIRDEDGDRVFADSDGDAVRDLPNEFQIAVWNSALAQSGLVASNGNGEVATAEEGKAASSPSGSASSSG